MSDIDKIGSPHIHIETSVTEVMQQVIFALIPGIIVSIWVLGWGVLAHCLLAISFALAFEAIMLTLRMRPLRDFMYDGSAIITGLLFALTITPFAPCTFRSKYRMHLFGSAEYGIYRTGLDTFYATNTKCFIDQGKLSILFLTIFRIERFNLTT